MKDSRGLMAYAGLALALGVGVGFTPPYDSRPFSKAKRKGKDRSKQKAARKAKHRNRKP